MATQTSDINDFTAAEFNAYINDPRFNQTSQLSLNPSLGLPSPFQISYADFGYRGDDEQILLYFGPLMSSRFNSIAKDELAKKYRVRIIYPERPGIGKTDFAPAERLLSVWRQAIPALLNHLRVRHVTIACHSAGTLFGLDFALCHPQYLSPTHPYIVIAGPWVQPSHSGMKIWNLASHLPTSLVSQTDRLATFFFSTLAPLTGASAVLSGSVGQLFSQSERKAGRSGADVDFEERIRGQIGKKIFSESVRGLGQEVQVLLRNGVAKDGWGDWGDFDASAPRLVEAIENDRQVGSSADEVAPQNAENLPRSEGRTLRMDVFFAEKDNMIGDAGGKGSTWFESCWKDIDGVDFSSEVVRGSDHDSVWDLRWDVMERVLQNMANMRDSDRG